MDEGPTFYTPDLNPIEWTQENEHLFMNGFYRVEYMTRSEFEAKFPSKPPTLPPA